MFPPNPPTAGSPNAPIVIRRARIGDIGAVRRIQLRSFPKKLAYTRGTLLLLWALPNARFLVAARGEAVVGCVIGDRQQGRARVVNIAVAPEARRQRIGDALLAAIERALPAGEMILMAQVENTAARRLYANAGYDELGVAKNYYGPGQDGVWMRKRFDHRDVPPVVRT